ncbi:hypothetical protein OC844_006713 [Tilletia horrida]|nr:hypothetical protein OC844_006713 [Tilletia horrida]
MRRLRRCLDLLPVLLALAAGLSSSGAQPLITGYWTDWSAADFPPEAIDMKRYDIINFSFGLPTASFDIAFNSAASTDLLRRLVAAADAAKTNTRIVLSIGGWLSSQYFSAAVATDASRLLFAQNIFKVLQQYRLDGADLDWEYPGSAGAGNPFSPSDAANFQIFLTTLRQTLGSNAIITVTGSFEPWDGADGQPMTDVSPAAAAVDAVTIMAYDVHQGGVGVNSPLADLCGNSTQPRDNAASGVKQWVSAGMPREKLLLGVPAYGYIMASTLTTLPQRRSEGEYDLPRRAHPRHDQFRPQANSLADPEGDSSSSSALPQPHPHPEQNERHETYAAAGFAPSRRTQQIKRQTADSGGQINFNSLVQQNILVFSAPEGGFVAAPQSGYTKYWDTCSDTPYLANGQRLITYDDPRSLRDKAAFALQAGLAGVGVWSMDADTPDGALLTALQQGLGR